MIAISSEASSTMKSITSSKVIIPASLLSASTTGRAIRLYFLNSFDTSSLSVVVMTEIILSSIISEMSVFMSFATRRSLAATVAISFSFRVT